MNIADDPSSEIEQALRDGKLTYWEICQKYGLIYVRDGELYFGDRMMHLNDADRRKIVESFQLTSK